MIFKASFGSGFMIRFFWLFGESILFFFVSFRSLHNYCPISLYKRRDDQHPKLHCPGIFGPTRLQN